MVRCTIREHRGIPSSSSQNRLWHLVDSQFSNRTSAIISSTQLHGLQVTADDLVIEDCLFRFAPDDYPYVQGTISSGEGVDIENATGVVVRRCCFEGLVPHSQLRIYKSTEITVEDCCLSNRAHTVLLVNGLDGVAATDLIIRRNRLHTYATIQAVAANGMQLQGIQDSTITDNVIFNYGLEAPGWGLTVEMNPLSTDTDASGNTVRGNVLVGCAMFLGYGAGQNTGYNKIQNNSIIENILVDLPDYNAAQAVSSAFNALIRVNLDDPLNNSFYGNSIVGNCLRRSDGGTIMAEQYSGSLSRNYSVTQLNSFPGCMSNTGVDPMFVAPEHNDFRLNPFSPITFISDDAQLSDDCLCDEEIIMPAPQVLMFADAVEHLAGFSGGTAANAEAAQIRSAAIDAYRHVLDELHWTHLVKHGRILLDEAYSTGTITYTHSSRTLTLATGTWPTWTKYGRIKIGNRMCLVADWDGSSASVTLDEFVNPGLDVAAGTSYSIRRYDYPLPFDLKGIARIHDENYYWYPHFVDAEAMLEMERSYDDSGLPFAWTITEDRHVQNGWVARLYGYPSEVRSMDFIYERIAPELVYSGYETQSRAGTVSNTGAAVTGTGTDFNDDMEPSRSIGRRGAYLRFSVNSSDLPTGRGGANRYKHQVEITAVASTTGLTLAASPGVNYSGVKYRITDALHLPQSLWSCYMRCCEWQLEMKRRGQGGKDGTAYRAYLGEIERASAKDSLHWVPGPKIVNSDWFLGMYPGQPVPVW